MSHFVISFMKDVLGGNGRECEICQSALVIDAVSEGRGFAVVHTRVELRDGGHAGDALQLAKRAGRWLVVAYELEPDGAGT